MDKYWETNDKRNRLIYIKGKSIFFGTPKNIDSTDFKFDIKKGIVTDVIFSIPYSYIRNVECQNKGSKIKIDFGKESEDEIYIENATIKNEIFNYLKSELSDFKYIEKILL